MNEVKLYNTTILFSRVGVQNKYFQKEQNQTTACTCSTPFINFFLCSFLLLSASFCFFQLLSNSCGFFLFLSVTFCFVLFLCASLFLSVFVCAAFCSFLFLCASLFLCVFLCAPLCCFLILHVSFCFFLFLCVCNSYFHHFFLILSASSCSQPQLFLVCFFSVSLLFVSFSQRQHQMCHYCYCLILKRYSLYSLKISKQFA